MQKKTEEHIFQGMQRDMSISKQKAEFLWDANNIRLTSRHGDTLFSMTNERGTKRIDNIVFNGVVLGYCVLGNYLTVFTTDITALSKSDYIYRIEKMSDGFNSIILYNGNLNFDVEHPIETLGVYENEKIQKVYWTDGVNQPRLINITKENVIDSTYIDTSFDFIPTLELNDSIHVTKIADSSGLFPAGVIQYAVTYYNKYGQESNVSVVSPLISTSYSQRAGSPEDTIGNAFKVTVKNPDTHFEYLRLYSIFRSSKDTTPVCKRVADIKLGYGGNTSNDLCKSSDSHLVGYAEITGHPMPKKDNRMFTEIKLTTTSSYIKLVDSEITKEQSQITVNGRIFQANHYWHFTKSQYPNLIIRDFVYNEQTEEPGNKITYFTWGEDCTDIYISDGLTTSDDTQDNAAIACNPATMIAAETIYYNTLIYNDSITVTDNGTIGDDVDYNELLFVGGEEIKVQTLTQKDGTMFLGNVDIKRPQIIGEYNITSDGTDNDRASEGTMNINKDGSNLVNVIRNNTHLYSYSRTCMYPLTMSGIYRWGNSLNAKDTKTVNNSLVSTYSTNVAGFKYKDHYRLGLQFQYKTGKWSQPVFIDDETENTEPSINNANSVCTQVIPTFIAELGRSVGQYLLEKGYKRVRSVVCFPTLSDQLIVCLGILNPTVFSVGHRHTHTPDILSSWFFRPVIEEAAVPQITPLNDSEPQQDTQGDGELPTEPGGGSSNESGTSDIDHTQDLDPDYEGGGGGGSYNQGSEGNPNGNAGLSAYNGAYIQYKDNHLLYTGITRGAEIQTAPRQVSAKYLFDDFPLSAINVDVPLKFNSLFVVDSNYVTMHSPEFEFNDSFRVMDFDTISCYEIKKALIAENIGDIHISTVSAPLDADAMGFFHTTIHSTGSARRICAGLFYMDSFVKKDNDDYKIETDLLKSYLIYPWHRTGSVNNDIARPDGKGSRTALLGQKKMTNLMFCEYYENYLNEQQLPIQTEIATGNNIRMFNSDQISLVKINGMNYYGNVDQVLNPRERYPIIGSKIDSFEGGLTYISDSELGISLSETDGSKRTNTSSEFAHMKYLSTPHAIIQLDEGKQIHEDNANHPYLNFAELQRQPNRDTDFGGLSLDAIRANLWYPAGPPVKIGYDADGNQLTDEESGKTKIPFWYGDTYYQRYDCLKTYPFTDEDTNSVIEIGSFMVETRINLDGRYDKNRGDTSNFMLNPTVFNKINPVYSQMDNFFNYRILDDDYYALNQYPTMVTWTGYKNNAAEVDNWTNITLASTLEMDGTKGKVNAVRVNSDQLYCFQDDAIGLILFNSRVQISPSDGVPIEISNNYKVDGNRYISTSIGCKNKWSIAEGVDGLYFIDDNTKALYMLGGQAQLKPISTQLNMSYWFMTKDFETPWIQSYRNTSNIIIDQKGSRCYYDKANADLYICTPEETLCYSEKLELFISFFDYHNVIGMFNIDSDYYALNYPDSSQGSSQIYLWGMFKGKYNTFFDKIYQTDFTFISNENSLNDKIFTNIDMRGDFRYWPDNNPLDNFNSPNHMVADRNMFNTIRVWNEYQDTGEVNLQFINDTHSNMKKKFRIWRMDIPRDSVHTRQRIRNTWSKVKFTMNKPQTLSDKIYDMEIHDMGVVYFV